MNAFYGTASEPRATSSPSWHVESDVTDLSAGLQTAQTGHAILGNFVGVSDGVTCKGIIYANAQLDFSRCAMAQPKPAFANRRRASLRWCVRLTRTHEGSK
jgi:hypothetical protein